MLTNEQLQEHLLEQSRAIDSLTLIVKGLQGTVDGLIEVNQALNKRILNLETHE